MQQRQASVENPPSEAGAETGAAPLVWALTSDRAGDRAQILALAEALAWPLAEKRLAFNRRYKRPNIFLGASRTSLDIAASSALAPPWPDLVIASGRRSTPIARWIRAQAGGHCRLVHIGRPWAPLDLFDLIVTTAQYALPDRPNILHNSLTLNRPDPARLAAASEQWQSRLSALPRPWIALLAGGGTRPYNLDAATARRLGDQANAMAAELGGSLLVSTSRRTGEAASAALLGAITGPAYRHRWQPSGENPYPAFLELADSFVVTGDSASMLSEACHSGRPVYIFDLPQQPDRKLRIVRRLRGLADSARRPEGDGWPARLFDRLVDLGLIKSTRDLTRFHVRLIERGLAARLGQGTEGYSQPPDADLARAVARVRALF